MREIEKVKTGIKGFDELVGGGFSQGHTILLSGTPGTGKTIFGLQFLYNGAQKFNEKGLYITFEEKEGALKKQAAQFGWDFEGLMKKRMLQILSIPASTISKSTVKDIMRIVHRFKIKRLVIDSLSTLSINAPSNYHDGNEPNEFTIKRFIYSFVNELKKMDGATSILISQAPDENSLSRDEVSEFICDCIVYIMYESMGGEFSRSFTVRKMRGTKNDEDIHPLEIGGKGIVIHNIKD
ncbi:MAG: AAA family ATPase [Nanoarchaeota archaeon]|nr:AAA family ATPase [Nanoarchaeota archaeon]